jgi:hypothetical protein
MRLRGSQNARARRLFGKLQEGRKGGSPGAGLIYLPFVFVELEREVVAEEFVPVPEVLLCP